MTSRISAPPAATASTFEIGRVQRALVTLVGVGLTSLVLLALIRAAAGYAATYRGAIDLAVIVHVASVLPAVPLWRETLLRTARV